MINNKTQDAQVFGILSFSKPFKSEEVVQSLLPRAQRKRVRDRAIYVDSGLGIEVSFPDDRNVLIGEPGTLEDYFARKPVKTGALSAAIKLAVIRPIVAAANISAVPIPERERESIPPDFRPLLKTQQLLVSVDLGSMPKLEIRASYSDETSASDAEKSIRALIAHGRTALDGQKQEIEERLYEPRRRKPSIEDLPEAVGTVFAMGALGRIDDILANPKLIVRSGKEITFDTRMPKELVAGGGAAAAVGVGLLLPAVQRIREAASRSTSLNNLKQISLAVWNYESANGRFPADITDKDGKPILSWRVAILPYIEQQSVYNGFKLDEPWDSENNKKMAKMKIKTFMSPSATVMEDKDGYGVTHYLGVSGPDAAFEPGKKLKVTDFTDGTSNTVMLVESGDAIAWAKPGDFPFDPKKPLPKLQSAGKPGLCLVAMCDGSVRAVNMKTVSEKTLKAAFTRNGGESLGKDW